MTVILPMYKNWLCVRFLISKRSFIKMLYKYERLKINAYIEQVEAELAQRRAALSQAEERHGSYAEKVKSLEEQLTVKNEELSRVSLNL